MWNASSRCAPAGLCLCGVAGYLCACHPLAPVISLAPGADSDMTTIPLRPVPPCGRTRLSESRGLVLAALLLGLSSCAYRPFVGPLVPLDAQAPQMTVHDDGFSRPPLIVLKVTLKPNPISVADLVCFLERVVCLRMIVFVPEQRRFTLVFDLWMGRDGSRQKLGSRTGTSEHDQRRI